MEKGNGLCIDLHDYKLYIAQEQVLGQYTSARANFQDIGAGFQGKGIRNFTGNLFVFEEVLPEMFLGAYAVCIY